MIAGGSFLTIPLHDPARRGRHLLRLAAVLGMALIVAGPAVGQDGSRTMVRPRDTLDLPMATVESPPILKGTPIADPCIAVDIAGHRARSDCAAQKLEDAARAAQRRAGTAASVAVPDARSADVVTGVANQTATRQRMGNTFGTSVHPQRPSPPVFTSPLAPRR